MTSQNHAVHVHRDDVGARMGMWLFLFTELLLFGGMFFLYSVYRFMNQDQFHIAAKELNTLIGTFQYDHPSYKQLNNGFSYRSYPT